MTLIALLYILLSSGPSASTHLLPWNQWALLSCEALLVVFWVAATSVPYTCGILCTACEPLDLGDGYEVWVGSLTCECGLAGDYRRRAMVKRALEARASGAIADAESAGLKAAKVAVREGLGVCMMYVCSSYSF